MLRTRIMITNGVVALALVVPGHAGAQTDLRSPDGRDAATNPTGAVNHPTVAGDGGSPTSRTDLRSPDGRYAGDVAAAGKDLVSPDARDSTRRSAPAQTDTVQAVDSASEGFRWGDAGIGAAGMLGVVFAVAGIALLVLQQRRRERLPVAGH